jgi:hypothetical protein
MKACCTLFVHVFRRQWDKTSVCKAQQRICEGIRNVNGYLLSEFIFNSVSIRHILANFSKIHVIFLVSRHTLLDHTSYLLYFSFYHKKQDKVHDNIYQVVSFKLLGKRRKQTIKFCWFISCLYCTKKNYKYLLEKCILMMLTGPLTKTFIILISY